MTDAWIRGIAAPFASWGHVEAGRERFRAGAFQRVAGRHIDLRVEHEGQPFASTRDATLQLKQGKRGLMFTALATSALFHRLPEMRRGQLGCSVGMGVDFRSEPVPQAVEGKPAFEITWAPLEHIALGSTPCYRETSVWFSNWAPEDVPSWVRGDMALWEADWGEGTCLGARDNATRLLRARAGAPLSQGEASSQGAHRRAHPRYPDAVWDTARGVWRRPASAIKRAHIGATLSGA